MTSWTTRRVLRVLVALLPLTLLPGCGGPQTGRKNTLYTYTPADIKALDPILASDTYSHKMVSEIFEGLMAYDYLARPYKAVPQLSEGMPKVSEDGLTWTFQLKKGVTFHDDACFVATGGKGREMSSKDFVYSWKRLADISNASQGWWILDGWIKGLNEWRQAKSEGKADYETPVEGLKTPDNYTLVVELTRPYPQLLWVLTMGYSKVVPHEAVKMYGKEFLNHPVGTGPYELKSWVKNSKITLTKYEGWRGETYPSSGTEEDKKQGRLDDAGKKVPFLDRVVVDIIIESQPVWLKFRQGDLDSIAPPKDNYDSALPGGKLSPAMAKEGIRNVRMPSLDLVYTAFNMEDPILGVPAGEKGLALRRALAMAIDRNKFIKQFYNDRATPAQGPIPPGLPGYDPEYQNPYNRFDPEGARKLLAEAGYSEANPVPKLAFDTSAGTGSMQIAEFYKQAYKAIGVEIDIQTNSWPELTKKVKTRRSQIWGMAWRGDYPDAQNFLQLFYSKNASPGPNGPNYNNPEFDKLYEKASTMLPSPERTELYEKMAKIVMNDAPMSFTSHRIIDTLVHGWLKNYKPHDMGHGFYKFYRVDNEEKAKLKAALGK